MSTNHHDGPEIGDDLAITRMARRASGPGTWVTGTLNGHRFVALVFSQHANHRSFEIGQSCISKLWLERLSDGKVVCNFDRGWDIRPTDRTAAAVTDFLAAELAERTFGNRGETASSQPQTCPSGTGNDGQKKILTSWDTVSPAVALFDTTLTREVKPDKGILSNSLIPGST